MSKMGHKFEDLSIYTQTGYTNKAYILLSISKKLVLSRMFIEECDETIKNSDHFVLAYSKREGAIILFFTKNKDAPGAKKIGKGTFGWQLDIDNFIKFYDIKVPTHSLKYKPVLENIGEHGKKWVIYL